MKYPDLIESCKKTIKTGRCLGCIALENPEFTGNPNCPYRMPTVAENIAIIHKNLGIQEMIKL